MSTATKLSTAAKDGEIYWDGSIHTILADGETGSVQVTPLAPVVARAFMSFDTSGYTVSAATLRFRFTLESGTCPDVEVEVSADTIDAGGLGADGAEAEFLQDYAELIKTIPSAEIVGNTWYELAIPARCINTTGYTDVRFRIADDLSLENPGGVSFFMAESADYGPQLILTLSAAHEVAPAGDLESGAGSAALTGGATDTKAIEAGTGSAALTGGATDTKGLEDGVGESKLY